MKAFIAMQKYITGLCAKRAGCTETNLNNSYISILPASKILYGRFHTFHRPRRPVGRVEV
jgi:hypothetical protein